MYKTSALSGIAAISGCLLLMSCNNKLHYPAAPQDGTTYQVSGVTVDDRYRPLENDTSAATAAWVAAENAVTRAYIDAIPFREKLRQRLTALNHYPRQSAPSRENDGRWYYSANDGSTNQSIVYRMDSIGAAPEVFLDPNTLSDNGTVALKGLSFNEAGDLAAYIISRSGSDWAEIYVIDTETGTLLNDHIEWAKFTDAQWYGDGFYYSAYDKPVDGKELSEANENHRVYYHRIGTTQSEDIVAYEDSLHPLHFHTAEILGDRYLAIYISGEGHGNAMYVKDLKAGGDFKEAEPSQEWEIMPIGFRNGKIYALTSADAPRYRVVAIDPYKPERSNWQTVIGEDPDNGVIVQAALSDEDKIITVVDRDASHHGYIFNGNGEKLQDVAFPTYGTASFACSSKYPEVYYTFTSFTSPGAVYCYNTEDGTSTPIFTAAVDGYNADDYITEQIFYTSKDGTRIPMFMVRRKDTVADGSNPVYLYGYGGFGISLNPGFSANRLLWLENGGIYVSVNLRGGNEYGESWHEAGTRMNKQNVFDDFIAAAEYLIDNGWTTADLLTIEGGSNGGLLVGAVVNQRPDLFRVAIPRVGVMDMMRYHLFTIGWNWAHDYGTADDGAEMAQYLLSYSPVHNIRDGVDNYPAILITTADHDDRVVPAHSFKYAAALQAAHTGDAPKLIRIDTEAGHGGGKPIGKVVDEYTDIYSFIYKNLGIDPSTER